MTTKELMAARADVPRAPVRSGLGEIRGLTFLSLVGLVVAPELAGTMSHRLSSRRTGAPRAAPAIATSVVLPTCQMILDVISDLLADGRQFKQLVLDDRIVGLLGKSPIDSRLVPEIIRPIHRPKIPMNCAAQHPWVRLDDDDRR